jgi:hypothetical protein
MSTDEANDSSTGPKYHVDTTFHRINGSRSSLNAVHDVDETPLEEFNLLVDNFERVSQKTYRHFYERIQFYMQQLLPDCSVDQSRLSHGDFHSTVQVRRGNGGDCSSDSREVYSLDFIVERKTLNDIVSRSNDTKSTVSLTAPHVKQANALQHCGLDHPFFLIEGDISKMHALPHAKVDYVGQVSVDMLTTTQSLTTFMAQMIAREWSTRKINLLQTWHFNGTAMLLVCMSYFAQKRYEARRNLRSVSCSVDPPPPRRQRDKYPSKQSIKNGKNTARTIKELYGDLKENNIHVEMCARVARR